MSGRAWPTRAAGRLLVWALTGTLVCALAEPALAQTADLVDRSALRVCSDPANMPFSNKAGEGFENKIAALLGAQLGVPVLYTWFPQVVGFVRNTLRKHKCDLVIGTALGNELVQNSNPYYQSTYVLIYPKGSPLEGVANLEDDRLQDSHIGIIAGTPPATILAVRGLIGRARPYQLLVDRRFFSPAEEMLADIAKGEIDAGVLWGPIGGYFAKQAAVPMAVVPLHKETGITRMVYRITMGMRQNEPDWKHQVNALIAANQAAINTILLDYGVPLLDDQGELITR